MYSINGITWNIRRCEPYSDKLKRSNGTYTVGMTDISTHEVWIADILQGLFLRKVLCHEVCHTAMASYGIDMSIEQEELFCDLIATYGDEIIDITDGIFKILKRKAA